METRYAFAFSCIRGLGRNDPIDVTPNRGFGALRSQRPLHTCRTTGAVPRARAQHSPGPGSRGPRRAAAPAGRFHPNRAQPRRRPRTGT